MNESLARRSSVDESMFTSAEFSHIRDFFESNSRLAFNKPAIILEMAGFQKEIIHLLLDWDDQKVEELKTAVLILLQGLNFLARYVGEPEFAEPDFTKLKSQPISPAPIMEKHVAVFIADQEDGTFYRSVVQVLNNIDIPEVHYCFYNNAQVLIGEILRGKVCGVVALQLYEETSIENHLKHDLKNWSGFDYGSAEKYVFPPCVDFAPPHPLGTILDVIIRLQRGTLKIAETGTFSLQKVLPNLVAQMFVPLKDQGIQVAIIDDHPVEVVGMETILGAWPNITVRVMFQNSIIMPDLNVLLQTDILLLDEAMPIFGTEIAKDLINLGFSGKIVSTTGGKKPTFTQWHFSDKRNITQKYSSAEGFVKLINSLLQK